MYICPPHLPHLTLFNVNFQFIQQILSSNTLVAQILWQARSSGVEATNRGVAVVQIPAAGEKEDQLLQVCVYIYLLLGDIFQSPLARLQAFCSQFCSQICQNLLAHAVLVNMCLQT